MRVALCLAGLAGSSNSKNRHGSSQLNVLKIGYEHYKRHILDKNDIDVFIHTWDVAFRDEIVEYYAPIKSVFEPQIFFNRPDYILDRRFNDCYSRWYSPKVSIGLKKQHEEENGFSYDCVMLGRFDQAWETDVIFSKFDMNFFYGGYWCEMFIKGKRVFKGGRGPLYSWLRDKKKIPRMKHRHKGYPNNLGRGILDFWFFSSSVLMNKLSTLYDCLDEYYKPEAGKRLFSKYPVVFPSSHIIVGHHLQQTGLIKKLKFAFHLYDDFPMVRRKYLGAKK